MSIEASKSSDNVRAVIWDSNQLILLDQRLLPGKVEYIKCKDTASSAAAIKDMVVRGAPAIGITAAYAVVLAARAAYANSPDNWRETIQADLKLLANSRPTAINLKWAIDRMQKFFAQIDSDPEPVLLREAKSIHAEDIHANQQMGKSGAELIGPVNAILTHCNTGSLATGGYGTALGVIRSAWQAGNLKQVYADETRPWLQGSRLTAWELQQDGIPVSLIVDSAANFLMSQGAVQWVIVGADRIVANGDVANKIGTYNLAVVARHHGVKMMVVAPSSTFDLSITEGSGIPVEDRGETEIVNYGGVRTAPENVSTWNPVFDITPANLIDVIVTEKGIIERPDTAKIRQIFG